MALSDREKKDLRDALADQTGSPSQLTEKLTSAVDAQAAAASVSALGTTSDINAAGLSTADTYTDAAVNAELDSLMGEVEARLDTIEAKIDEVLAALNK